jgi:hypothetical protein
VFIQEVGKLCYPGMLTSSRGAALPLAATNSKERNYPT